MAQMTWSSTGYQQPEFAAEQLSPDKLLPGGSKLVASQFPREDAVTATLAAGAVTAGTRTLTFATPLTNKIPAGTILNFGSGKFVTFPTEVAKGATSAAGTTVAADLAGGESATFPGSGPITVDAGTLVGRTFAERDADVGYGQPDVDSSPDSQLYLTAFAVMDATINADVTLIRHGTLIYENKLPGWSNLSNDARARIRERYQCIQSA